MFGLCLMLAALQHGVPRAVLADAADAHGGRHVPRVVLRGAARAGVWPGLRRHALRALRAHRPERRAALLPARPGAPAAARSRRARHLARPPARLLRSHPLRGVPPEVRNA